MKTHLGNQVPISNPQTLEGSIIMLKKITFAAIAAVSLLAGPALAGPSSSAPAMQYSIDFQAQGR